MTTLTQKYFRTTVTVTETYEISVPADNEEAAGKAAVALVSDKTRAPTSRTVACSSVHLEAEAPFKEGVKIKHVLFGEGEILEVIPTASAGGADGFAAKVKFAGGEVKTIQVSSMSQDKLQIIG